MTQAAASFATSGDQVHIVRTTERQRDLDKLPSVKTRRWVMRRKAQVVAAVRNGVITLPEACERYHLSEEEFKSWSTLLDSHGMHGLRATRIQEYRGGAAE
ncbi:MAG TPA: DUF1153 domain-containing protein [Rhodospirillaceae bacterium]|nr:DUF1153 domain-containing protein [Rhodospirillaceae bacterium]